MVAEIDATKQGRRHPRRRRRGARLRPAAGPGQPRARRPPPRRPAGRRADGHPGDQGRRGRRRLRAGPHPRLAGPRRDRARRRRRDPPRHRPLRRHRGRHDHRRGAARARGDEADLDRARGRCSTVDTATGEAAVAINQRSDVCAVPAAGVVAEAMVALVLAEAVLEKFGGDSVAETRRNVEAYLERLAERGLTPAESGSRAMTPAGRAGRAARRGQDARPAGGWPRSSASPFADSDDLVEAADGPHRAPRSSPTDGEAGLPRARGRGGRRRARPASTACSPSAAAR